MRVLVAGGTGFLGTPTVAELARRHDVVALGLPTERASVDAGAELVLADVLEPDVDVDDLLRGVDAVVSMIAPRQRSAAKVGAGMRAVSARLAGAAARSSARRYLHISNPSVFSAGEDWIDDDTAPAPGYPLGHDTLATERLVTSTLARAGTPTTVLRVAAAYDRDTDGRILGVAPDYVEPGTHWQSFVSVADVARAVAVILDRSGRPLEEEVALPPACTVADGIPLRARDAAIHVARSRDKPVRRIRRERARRYGANPFGMLTSSLRLRATALRRLGWAPTDQLGPVQAERLEAMP
jgi:nucleoside-diphosphate-sugar epimerase